ncbi:MAG TPA: hypothetical protein PK157_22295 [Bryobacteraceae bacterium]|nr:hypothetical protein [Bryobacteraceae bacterium]
MEQTIEQQGEKARSIVSLDELDLVYEGTVSIDLSADPFEGPPPVPDGIHFARLGIFRQSGDSGLKAGRAKDGRPFIMVRLQGTIEAEGKPYHGFKVFDQASTMIMRNGTCRIAGILHKLQQQVPSNTNPKELVRLLQVALEGEPLIGIETQWQAQSQQDDGTYKTILRGMKRFPPRLNPETGEVIPGEYLPVIEDPRTGERVTAQAVVLRYLTIDETNKELEREAARGR